MYKCKDCNKQFIGGKRRDKSHVITDYVEGKQTLIQLSAKYKVSERTIRRDLEGMRFVHSIAKYKEITVQLAEQITEKIVGEEQNDVTIDKVQRVVCDYFNITRDDLLSKTRKRQIVQARQIAMYMSRNLISNCSLSTIGAEIGGKDHATVLHACTTVGDLMSTDKTFKQYVTDIEKLLVPVRRYIRWWLFYESPFLYIFVFR